MDNHKSTNVDSNNKSNFWIKKDCALHSLKEVECFLHNLDKASRYIHLYKFLR